MKKILAAATALVMMISASGCGKQDTEIQVFAAASLNGALTEIAENYNQTNPTRININADSSGTLLTQIEEGYDCDIFFSAATKQMNKLEEDGLVIDGTREDLLKNKLVLITQSDSDTTVASLNDLKNAKSIALAGGSVPAGKYTRQALTALGILNPTEDVSKITTEEVSKALGGVEISEQSNVSKVLTAVAEGSCEVGTVYYSDTYGYEDKVRILEEVDEGLTGKVVYPICQVENKNADKAEAKAAKEFFDYLKTDDAKQVFEKYYFELNN